MSDTDASSRRALLAAAGGATIGMAIAACGGSTRPAHPKKGTPVAHSDIELLNHLIDLENLAVAAYTAAVPLLAPRAAAAAKRFLQQELDHAGGLGQLVRDAGGKPRKPRPHYDLDHPRTSEDILRLLHRVETSQLAAYLDTIPRLQPAAVRAMAAAFLSNDAQHVSVIRAELGIAPVPTAFVTGRE